MKQQLVKKLIAGAMVIRNLAIIGSYIVVGLFFKYVIDRKS